MSNMIAVPSSNPQAIIDEVGWLISLHTSDENLCVKIIEPYT